MRLLTIPAFILSCTAPQVDVASVGVTCGGPPIGVWDQHTLSDFRDGADGVVAVGDLGPIFSVWEESGDLAGHFFPGAEHVQRQWATQVIDAKIRDPEDVRLGDLDLDGALDLVAFSEWKNSAIGLYFSDNAFHTWNGIRAVQSIGKRWLTGEVVDVNGDGFPDILGGGKLSNFGPQSELAWFENPGAPFVRDPNAWTRYHIAPAAWVMSIHTVMESGAVTEIYAADRFDNFGTRGFHRFVRGAGETWLRTTIIADEEFGISSKSGDTFAVPSFNPNRLTVFERQFPENAIEVDVSNIIRPLKAAYLADVDLDGNLDIIITTSPGGSGPGVWWIRNDSPGWSYFPVSDFMDTEKLDSILFIDMDGDGDRDIVTSEEADGLGVIWFENPRCGL